VKDLGARFGGAGTTAAGAAVVAKTISALLGIHPRVVDGSGLSHSDRTTPLDVTSLLVALSGTQIGATWTFTCSEPQEQWRGSGRLVGIEPVTVAHQRIVALHTRVVVNLAGRNTGDNPSDYWFALDDSQLLVWRGTVDVSQGTSPLGSVRYHEQFDLTLADAAPAR